MADITFAQFLRDLADWYESHPSVPEPYGLDSKKLTCYSFTTADKSKEILRALGPFKKDYPEDDDKYFNAVVEIGGRELCFTFYRDRVCQPKVVGTRHVEAQLIPESYSQSRVIAAHDEDVIEWDCSDSVLAPAGAAGDNRMNQAIAECEAAVDRVMP